MNCKETQDNIPRFLKEELDMEELSLFLEHIELCDACMDELEVYHTLHTGMRILEDNVEFESNNFEIDLKKELEGAKEKFKRAKRRRLGKNVLFIVLVIIIGIFVF